MGNVHEGLFNYFKDVHWNAAEIVVTKSIESTKKPASNGMGIPAAVRKA